MEQCEEVPGLYLEDGTTKIFLNMTSKNGSHELVSLLKYMKDTRLDNPEILIKDRRILELDGIVREVKESEEWEVVQMNIMEIAMEKGMEYGVEQGIKQGEDRMSILNIRLLEENRLDELRKCLEDAEYRKQLYAEYDI